jgi:hypothetical protein
MMRMVAACRAAHSTGQDFRLVTWSTGGPHAQDAHCQNVTCQSLPADHARQQGPTARGKGRARHNCAGAKPLPAAT